MEGEEHSIRLDQLRLYHARWDECIATLQQHLAMPQARWADKRSALYDLGALACYELGLMHKACEFAKEATERSPEDSRLSHNYALIRARLP
ncbi:hypothetical protein [Paenibacillus polymyxa]|uniref:hypothetical protein n=2 Tax=Paenibacillus polymyxa TaxID=1406 RepID=UPI0007EBAA1E|nr:hypothetical protein [Paenibacillus polymyxa]OAZ46596.1 hypothetical protein A9Z39_19340 [Paenibacillus polymyxa]